MTQDYSLSRILCVDDDPSLLVALKTGLEFYGFKVITAPHGVDALTQYKAHAGDFKAIVTDNDMPQMNGWEFVRSVREIGFEGRIVVVSGHLSVESLRQYQDFSISGFFHKPFEMSLLATMLLEAHYGDAAPSR